MKHLTLAFLLVFALLLSACGGSAPAAGGEQAAVTEEPTLVSPALTALLNSLRDTVQPGTAGGSLRAAQAAAELLDWAENPAPEENIAATVSDWLSAQSEDARALLPEQLLSLGGMVERLTTEFDASAGLLDDAGLSGRGPWSAEAAQTALALLDMIGR